MTQPTTHWTNKSAKAFLHKISFDFVTQIEEKMSSDGISSAELANRLGVSKGRVSQIMNNPGNLTLKTTVECVRALGIKVSIVAYDDDDPNNDSGPINSQIFTRCWQQAGRPTDLFAVGAVASTDTVQTSSMWSSDYYRVESPTWEDQAEPFARLNPYMLVQGVENGGTDTTQL